MFEADECFYNGKIYTMETEGKKVEALVVYNKKIIFAGTTKEALAIPSKAKFDLEGKTVIPGFSDTHCHISEVAETPLRTDLTPANNISEVQGILLERKKFIKEGEWIVGCNLDANKLVEKRFPNRYELDEVSKDIPIIIHDIGLHNFLCNSLVLQLADIGKGFDKPSKELLELDSNGVPNGICHEHGLLVYLNKKRPSIFGTYEKSIEALSKVLNNLAKMGYTTIHTYNGFSGSLLDEIYSYQDLERRVKLPVRIVLNENIQRAFNNSIGALSGLGNEKIKYGALKIFVDGTFAVRSAYLLEPYSDCPSTKGRLIRSYDDLKQLVKIAYEKGNDIATHVIGDGAAMQMINIIEEIYDPKNPCRFTMIHCHLVHDDMRSRMAKLPIIASMQPIFMELRSTGTIEERIGAVRAKDFHAFKSLIDAGVTVTGSSDAPCANQNPIMGIDKAVNRIGCFGKVINAQEKISVYDAVSLYTKNAAYCGHEEKIKGTLENGKYADFITLDKNIFEIKPEDVGTVKVTATYLGGEKTA